MEKIDDLVLAHAEGGDLNKSNFPELVEALRVRLMVEPEYAIVLNPCPLDRVRHVLNACFDAVRNDFALETALAQVIENLDTVRTLDDLDNLVSEDLGITLREHTATHKAIATVNEIDARVVKSFSTTAAQNLPSFQAHVAALPPSPDQLAVRRIGLSMLTVRVFRVALQDMKLAEPHTVSSLKTNLFSLEIKHELFTSWNAVAQFYIMQFRAVDLICQLLPGQSLPLDAPLQFFRALLGAIEASTFSNVKTALLSIQDPNLHDIVKHFKHIVHAFDNDPTSFDLGDAITKLGESFLEIEANRSRRGKNTSNNDFNTPKNKFGSSATPKISGGVQDRSSRIKNKNGGGYKHTATDVCLGCNRRVLDGCLRQLVAPNNNGVKVCPMFELLRAQGVAGTNGLTLLNLICGGCGAAGHKKEYCASTPAQQQESMAMKKLAVARTEKKIKAQTPSKSKGNSTTPAWSSLNADPVATVNATVDVAAVTAPTSTPAAAPSVAENLDLTVDSDGNAKPEGRYGLVVTSVSNGVKTSWQPLV